MSSITGLLKRGSYLVNALAQGVHTHATAYEMQTVDGTPQDVSPGLIHIWGKFSIFHTHSSASSVLCNVMLAAYHLGCLFEVSLLIDYDG